MGTLKEKLYGIGEKIADKVEEVGEKIALLREGELGFLCKLTVSQSPNAIVPLVAVASVRTSGEFSRVIVRAIASDHTREQTIEATGSKLELPFWGLRAGRSYTVSLGLVGADTTVWSEPVSYCTPKLPDDFPPLTLKTARPEAMEPGVILFPVCRYVDDETGNDHDFGMLVIVDAEGHVVWYYQDTEGSIEDVRQLPNGNLLFNLSVLDIAEMDLAGEFHGRWVATGHIPSTKLDRVRVSVDAFHHEIYPLDNDTILALTTSLREVENFPTSDDDPNAPTETANIVDDTIVEFSRKGEIKSSIHMADIVSPTRIGYGSLDSFWDALYMLAKGGTRDWAHSNAVIHDRRDDTLIVSMRHQDAILKLRRGTGEVVWILGVNEDWGELSNRVLRPIGDTKPPFHTHAPTITPTGTLLLHDNGNYRARPYKERLPAEKNRSRAVEFRIDEQAGTYEQIWSFEGDPSAPFYAAYVGDADPMPKTGNVLVTQGGIVENDGKVSDDVFSGHHRAAIWEVTREAKPTVVFHLLVGREDVSYRGYYVYRRKAEQLVASLLDARGEHEPCGRCRGHACQRSC